MEAYSVEDMWDTYYEERDATLRERLILQYAPLVKYVVGRMAIGLPAVLNSEDIISHGTVGLIEAVERFDPRHGIKFETFAIHRIRGSIIDAVRDLDIVPRGARKRASQIEATFARLQQDLGRAPSNKELADTLGLTEHELSRAMMDGSFTTVSLDGPASMHENDESLPLGETIEDTSSWSPEQEAEIGEVRTKLGEAIDNLSERERLVVSLYYHDELTLREISRVLGVSESRVCQIHTRAVLKLRSALRAARVTPAGRFA